MSSVTLLMGFTMLNTVKTWPWSFSGLTVCLQVWDLATAVMQEGCRRHHHHVSTFYQEFHQGFLHQVLWSIFPELWRLLTHLIQPDQNVLVSTTWQQRRSHLVSKLNASFEEIKCSIHKTICTCSSFIGKAEGMKRQRPYLPPPSFTSDNITTAEKKHEEWLYPHCLSNQRGTQTIQQVTGGRIMSIW